MLDTLLGIYFTDQTKNSIIERNNENWEAVREVPGGELIHNATEKYNNRITSKELTKTDTKDDKILALTTRLYKLQKNKTSVIARVKGGGYNINQNRTNTNLRDPKNSYVEVLNNLESWRVKK